MTTKCRWLSNTQAARLPLEFHNKSFREIVEAEAIVKKDQQYRVSFSNGVVDIFSPGAREDRSNLLNKVLKDFSVTEMETRQADFQLFCGSGFPGVRRQPCRRSMGTA
jgi:hypothetical protein